MTITCPKCGTKMELEVLSSTSGFYLGRQCKCGPCSRETNYFKTREMAEDMLELTKETK